MQFTVAIHHRFQEGCEREVQVETDRTASRSLGQKSLDSRLVQLLVIENARSGPVEVCGDFAPQPSEVHATAGQSGARILVDQRAQQVIGYTVR